MADNPKSGVNTGTEVTTQIETSSNGKKPKKHKVIKGCLTVFVIFFVLSLIIGFASGNKSNSSQTSSSESSESSSTQTSTQSLQQTPVVDKTELEKAISSVGTLEIGRASCRERVPFELLLIQTLRAMPHKAKSTGQKRFLIMPSSI